MFGHGVHPESAVPWVEKSLQNFKGNPMLIGEPLQAWSSELRGKTNQSLVSLPLGFLLNVLCKEFRIIFDSLFLLPTGTGSRNKS